MARLTYETILTELYRELPEFYDEVIDSREWDEFDDDDRRSQYTVIASLPSWYDDLARGGRSELVARTAEFIERLANDAAGDEDLDNLFALQVGEGFPYSDRGWAALGPASRERITRANGGRRPPTAVENPEAIDAAIEQLQRRYSAEPGL